MRHQLFSWAAALALVVFHPTSASSAEPLPPDVDYRHVHQDAAMDLFNLRDSEALEWLEPFVDANPTDSEGLFLMAGALAQAGRMDEAIGFVNRAEAAGVPLERFIAGPRQAFAPLSESAPFQRLIEERGGQPIVHGPMIGALTDQSIQIWIRAAKEVFYSIEIENADGQIVAKSAPIDVTGATDFTGVASVGGLAPSTRYAYSILIDGKRLDLPAEPFRTFPKLGARQKLRFAFGACAAYTPRHEFMWNVINAQRPDAFLILGDNVYIDAPRSPEYQRYNYYRRQSRPEFRALVRQTPVFAIYDDHDFGDDDSHGGPAIDAPAWKRPVWNVFKQNWANPSYGGGEEQPGCWHQFSIGDIDFFMLDCRYYRTDPRNTPAAERTMLGPAQKAWLLAALKNSQGAFKFIASSVPWAEGTKPGSLDTWDGFAQERAEIFDFIQTNKIEGVLLLSGDRHRHDVYRIERPGGYPLYEFESAKITSVHTHRAMSHALFSSNDLGFGLFDIDTTKPDPELRYRVIGKHSEAVHELTLRKSQLTFPD